MTWNGDKELKKERRNKSRGTSDVGEKRSRRGRGCMDGHLSTFPLSPPNPNPKLPPSIHTYTFNRLDEQGSALGIFS